MIRFLHTTQYFIHFLIYCQENPITFISPKKKKKKKFKVLRGHENSLMQIFTLIRITLNNDMQFIAREINNENDKVFKFV